MHTTNVRMFKVALQLKGKPVVYPAANGEKSLKLMEKLHAANCGFNPVAHTSANGIDEELTLSEMRDIYSDWIEQ